MIMSEFKLDVDVPYVLPQQEEREQKPERIPYPKGDVKYGHYGRYVEKMVDKCGAMDASQEKSDFTQAIANLMKQNALNYNRNTVTDDVVFKDLQYLSKGKISVEGIGGLTAVKTIQGNKLNDFLEDGFRKNVRKNKKRKFKKRG
jgi:hypothetical protein